MQSSSAPLAVSELVGNDERLRSRLVWITLFRAVAAASLLTVYAIRSFSRQDQGAQEALTFVGAIFGLILVQAVWLRMFPPGIWSAVVHVLGDILVCTILVALTGGLYSPFTFAYLLAVVGGALLLGQRGANAAAGASSLAFVLLVLGQQAGLFPGLSRGASVRELVFICTTNAVALMLTAALAGFMGGQLRLAGWTLRAREQDLADLATFQKAILDSMPSGLLTCRGDQVVYMNPAAQAILQVGTASLPLSLASVLPGMDLHTTPARSREDLLVQTPQGERALGLTRASLQTPGEWMVIFQDLTDLRRAEEELERSDRLAQLGHLGAQLAHEIRNPLAAMRGSAQLLSDTPDPQMQQLVEVLRKESDRLAGLVSDFLAFARPPPPVVTECRLDTLVSEIVDLLRHDPLTSGVEVKVQLAEVSAPVDPGQLRQVLVNVIRNALSAAGKGGKVRVWLSHDPEHRQIHVWDSGGRISRSDLPHIFEPFFTRTPGGTGLGLSTAHSIIRAHRGFIRVSSSPAEGTEFIVALRAA